MAVEVMVSIDLGVLASQWIVDLPVQFHQRHQQQL